MSQDHAADRAAQLERSRAIAHDPPAYYGHIMSILIWADGEQRGYGRTAYNIELAARKASSARAARRGECSEFEPAGEGQK